MESFPTHFYNRGYTLIELLVVLAIITVITGIILTGQGSFNSTVILTDTAYDVALSIRSAEMYGVNAKSAIGATNVGYGVHIQSGTPGSYILFADSSPATTVCHPVTDSSRPNAVYGDCVYTAGNDQLITNYSIGNGITIKDFCAHQNSGWSCFSGGAISKLDIVFARPDPNPFISMNGFYDGSIDEACIALTSPQGGAKYVYVTASGEIAVNNAACQ